MPPLKPYAGYFQASHVVGLRRPEGALEGSGLAGGAAFDALAVADVGLQGAASAPSPFSFLVGAFAEILVALSCLEDWGCLREWCDWSAVFPHPVELETDLFEPRLKGNFPVSPREW